MGRTITVLVVEDDDQMAYFYHEILGFNGYRVLHAISLAEAETIIASTEELDAVILDGNVIGGTTTQLVTDIRSRYPSVKIVAATDDDSLREKLIDAGADSHARKFDAPHLVTIILNNSTSD